MIKDAGKKVPNYLLVTISLRLQVELSPISSHIVKRQGICEAVANWQIMLKTKVISSQNSPGVLLHFITGTLVVICVSCTYGENIL